VLLIDEAHAMPAESLEEIRLLSNLESKATKLLQIALFAQPELDERLAATDMRQLRERITQHFNLTPLKQTDVAAYIEFRLRAAGYHGPNPFTDEAIRMITRISEGLSRRINIIADKALLAAYSCGNHQVDANEVKTAEQDARFSPLQAKASFNAQPLLWGLAGAAVAALLIAMTVNLGSRTSSSDAAAPAKQANDEASKAPATRPDTPAAAPLDKIRFGPLTRQHLAQYEEWIKDAPRTHYFIQLLGDGFDPYRRGRRLPGPRHRGSRTSPYSRLSLQPVRTRPHRRNLRRLRHARGSHRRHAGPAGNHQGHPALSQASQQVALAAARHKRCGRPALRASILTIVKQHALITAQTRPNR
jgi:hypothetical protein